MLLSRPSVPSAAALVRLVSPSRVIFARVVAVGALALLFASSAAVLTAAGTKPGLAPADARYITARVVDVDQEVRARLVRVSVAGGFTAAQRATRDAFAALHSLDRAVRAGGSRPLAAAIAGELRFLDAAGSVLMNRRSPELARLPALDAAARRSLAALPRAHARRVGGVRSLVRWRRGRV